MGTQVTRTTSTGRTLRLIVSKPAPKPAPKSPATLAKAA